MTIKWPHKWDAVGLPQSKPLSAVTWFSIFPFPREGQGGISVSHGASMTFSFGFLFYFQKVRNMALDEVVILNVDTNTLETPFDDLQSLPNDVVCNEPLGLWLLCVYACVRAFGGRGVAHPYWEGQGWARLWLSCGLRRTLSFSAVSGTFVLVKKVRRWFFFLVLLCSHNFHPKDW